MFDLNTFINKHVTKHEKRGMFLTDIGTKCEKLAEKIAWKSVLVIGGAGSIGSSFAGFRHCYRQGIETLFAKLNAVFAKEDTTKEEVVEILAGYLPNFEYIETGKSFDSKM